MLGVSPLTDSLVSMAADLLTVPAETGSIDD